MITTNIHGVMHTTVQRHEHTVESRRFDTLEISVYGANGLLTTIHLFVRPGQMLAGISESPADVAP